MEITERSRLFQRPVPVVEPLPCRLLLTAVVGATPPKIAESSNFAGVERLRAGATAIKVSAGLVQTRAAISQPRGDGVAAVVGSQALFAGGDTTEARPINGVDIYDGPSGKWSTAKLSQAGIGLTATTSGMLAFFAGGSTVDIYDASTGVWSAAALSQSRYYMSSAAVAGKVIFAGGYLELGRAAVSATVDIYDVATGRWSTAALSQARNGMAVTTVGTKAIFAGGAFEDVSGNGMLSNVVDIYDASNGHWSTATLSQARGDATAAVVGDLAIFAGGASGSTPGIPSYSILSDVVDIYDASTGGWSTAALSEARAGIAATTVGQRVLFAGGQVGFGATETVDIFDAASHQWSTAQLSQVRTRIAATAVGSKAMFAGGEENDTVDIYDANTSAWSTAKLSQARVVDAAVTLGSRAIFAGGVTGVVASYVPTNTVDTFIADTFSPTATLISSVTRNRSRASYSFTVSYHDPFGIDADTINRNDIVIDGPAGFEARATVVSQSRGKSAGTRVVTYAIHAPGRRWDASDDGVYAIHLQDGQVTDIAGNAAIARNLGTLTVAIPAASPTSVAPAAAMQRNSPTFQSRRKISDLLAA
jgi:hypothetical protein